MHFKFTIYFIAIFWCFNLFADINQKYSSKLDPNDYLLGSRNVKRDPVFDPNRQINLGFNLGIGSDCGRVNFKSTLRATLKNLLNTEYFGEMGKDILAASPMLVTCYFSPTWCAILKHTRISANFLAQMRLDQCSLIDKYVDSRTEDFYLERQQCIRKAIENNGGNMEVAMKQCGNSNVYGFDLSDWSGGGGKASTNKLIESSAKWAGFSNSAAKKVVGLAKSLVGDMAVAKGKISVDYGPKKVALTPRTYYKTVKERTKALLEKLVSKVESLSGMQSVDKAVKQKDLQKVSGSDDDILLDKQTIRSLAFMPYRQQDMAITKLAEAIAITRFANDMNKTLDVLHVAAQNPNLPDKKRRQIRNKKNSLKGSVELTLELHKSKTEPLNKVLHQINFEGKKHVSKKTQSLLDQDITAKRNHLQETNYWDCADSVMCEGGN